MCLPSPLRILIDLSSSDVEVRRYGPPLRKTSYNLRLSSVDADADDRYYVIKPSHASEKRTSSRTRSYASEDYDEDDFRPSSSSSRVTHTKTTYYKSRPSRRRLKAPAPSPIESISRRVDALEQKAMLDEVAESVKAKIKKCPTLTYDERWEYREPKKEPGRWIVERRPVWEY
jgi:hypothetical protein